MPALTRPPKITFAEMRASGVRGLLIYCSSGESDIAADMKRLEKWLAWEKLSLAEADILLAEWQRFKEGEPI
jgi:hypothetical protein